MPRETVREKAGRLLLEGRVLIVSVGASGVVAHVRGESGLYVTSWAAGLWSCSCPHIGRSDCSHVLAVKRITAVDLPEPGAA